jgi:hypothetical protein
VREMIYKLNEKQLFQLIKENLLPDLVSTDEYNHNDGFSLQYGITIELKCRTRHFDTLVIEKPKYDALIAKKKCRYINSTPQGIYSWNLKKIPEPNWIQKEMVSSTLYFRNSNMTLKTVGYLHIKDAKNITKNLIK